MRRTYSVQKVSNISVQILDGRFDPRMDGVCSRSELRNSPHRRHRSHRVEHPHKDARLFCDMQCSGTFSDFRICQSGASSWYYIHEGECWFYCIPPTTDSLSKFSEWFKAAELFFGDVVSQVSLFLFLLFHSASPLL